MAHVARKISAPVARKGFVMISIYFAPPRTGKTTFLARIALREHIKKKLGISNYDRVFANFPCKYTYEFDPYTDFGAFDMSNSLILWDEIGISLNNRAYKTMSQATIEAFKIHGHRHQDIIGCSQSFCDCDITVRRLATEFRLLQKCWFWPNMGKALRIIKNVGISDDQDIIDAYKFDPLPVRLLTTRRFYMPLYWGMFDSWEARKLPHKEFVYHD